MGALRYYGRVLRAAFTHSLSLAQDIIFGAVLVAGTAAFILHWTGVNLDLTPWLTALGGSGIAAIVFGSIITIRLLLAPYWLWKEQNDRLDSYFGKATSPKSLENAATPPKIEICSKPGAPYEVSDIIEGRPKSTVTIGIKNTGGAAISNCKVFVSKLSPPPQHPRQGPVLLDGGGFTLHSFDPEKLVDIAVYWEHLGKYRFLEPGTSTFSGPYSSLTLVDTDARRSVIIQVVAAESRRSAMFHIWVDATKTLRLEFVGDAA